MPSGTENFTVDSALLTELGERLVTTPHVAITELVKNSYDADATYVRIEIVEDENGAPTFHVEDDGCGMTSAELRDFWMRIGTTHKANKDQHSRKYGRPVTGAKGIGRFSVRRLGKKVALSSTAHLPVRKGGKKSYERTQLSIDWSDFKAGEELGSVPVKIDIEHPQDAQTGLSLTISGGGEHEWGGLEDKRSYSALLRQLAMLTANAGAMRSGFEVDPGFKIFLKAPRLDSNTSYLLNDVVLGKDNLVIDIRERLYKAGWGELKAKIVDGVADCSLQAQAPVQLKKFKSETRFPLLTDVSLHLAIFVEDREWIRDKSTVALGQLNELLKNWGGVQVRLKGMRVYPYGDPGDDWLKIDADRARRISRSGHVDVMNFASANRGTLGIDPKRYLLSLLSSKAFLGAIEIGENQKGLEPKADRMGFLENEVFEQLQAFVRLAIDWAMVWRDHSVRLSERKKSEAAAERLSAIINEPISKANSGKDAIRFMKSSLASAKEDPLLITPERIEQFQAATSLIELDRDRIAQDLRRFQLVASTATLTLLFAHEVKHLLLPLHSLRAEFKARIKTFPSDLRENADHLVNEMAKSIDNLNGLLSLTEDMGMIESSGKGLRLDLRRTVEEAVGRFRRVLDSYGIQIENTIRSGILVGPMIRGELMAVMLNAISNSIKAVIAKSHGKPLIGFSSEVKSKNIILRICDNGVGLDVKSAEQAFVPLLADVEGSLYASLKPKLAKEDRQLLGAGSGLGLSIIRALVETRGGSVKFVTPEGGWNTCLEVTLTC
jgi:signal transduction histidine kinase